MAGTFVVKFSCALLVCMVAGAPLAQAAISCGQVTATLAPCIPYLTGKVQLTPGCCGGVKTLNSQASTTPDRQQACNCLKSDAGAISGIDYSLAEGLPGKCGVNIPYKISPSTNCASVK